MSRFRNVRSLLKLSSFVLPFACLRSMEKWRKYETDTCDDGRWCLNNQKILKNECYKTANQSRQKAVDRRNDKKADVQF